MNFDLPKIHHLLPAKHSNGSTDKITMANEPSIGICTLTYTNNFCIIGSNDEYVRVWLNNFTQVYIAAKYDQTRVLILIIFGSIGILNLVNKEYMNLIRSYTQFIIDIDYDDTRKQMISVGQDETIRI
ncbi:unnamed protein product [Rotaria sp. Silwood1]|nr:unnamed protein product [Rotaria sp. Silwood1]CAF4614369.1 unnamed protein product [Rotaria sp. Silwood1]CAF4806073.1 unnamed protein product [Rotaria sp. Silwood1]